MPHKKLVITIDVRDAHLLKGRRTILPHKIDEALKLLGLGLSLEDLYEVDGSEVKQVTALLNEVANDYGQLLAQESKMALKTMKAQLPKRFFN